MKTNPLLILIILCIFLSCKKADVNSNLSIKAGFECGWGSGTDSIMISETLIKYVYYIPAMSQVPIINKTRNVTDSEWTGIINDVNIDNFAKLKYQSCNICVDGCDEWIFIQNDQFSHSIRFAKGLKIDTISKLQGKLEQLRAEFAK